MTDVLDKVVVELKRLDIAASVEYPGFIAVPANKVASWHFGTANATWGGELVTERGTILDTTDFGLSRDTDDAELIANTIWELVR
jgi:hypothetical protein